MAVAAILVLSKALDIPKSPIFSNLSLFRKILAVFKSRWMIRLHTINVTFHAPIAFLGTFAQTWLILLANLNVCSIVLAGITIDLLLNH